jgi:hypothetical protein
MATKTSYVAMGYKKMLIFGGVQKVSPSANHRLFFSLATEGLKTTHPVTLQRLQSCEKKQNIK